jgi:hypothetical protein
MKRQIALFIGNLLDHYDTALYGLLGPLLASLFFPKSDPLTQLILVYALVPLGMLARPLGALLIGRIGDTKGRKEALLFSLIGMALVTMAIGALPTYAMIGLAAPCLLACGRILQNFFSAGESVGGVVTLIESEGDEQTRRRITGWYNASTVGGIVLASLLIRLHVPWRLLYIGGSLTLLVAFRLRSRLTINAAPREGEAWSVSLLVRHWKSTLRASLLFGFSYATFSVAIVLLSALLPLCSDVTREEMASWNVALLALDCALLPLCARLPQRSISIALFIAMCSPLLFPLLATGSLPVVLALRVAFVAVGVVFSATMQCACLSLFPRSIRYSLSSLSASIGALLFGGITTPLSLWLYKVSGSLAVMGLYWAFLAFAARLALAKGKAPIYTAGYEAK